MNAADIRRKVARFETCMEHDDRDIFYMGNALADVVELGEQGHHGIPGQNCEFCVALARVKALKP